MKSSRGFTLVEVLVAMVILTFLAFFTSQSIQKALKSKVKIQHETDKNSTLRDALKVIERDVNYAFNYRSPSIELYNKTQEERKKKALAPPPPPPGKPGDPPPPPAPPTPPPAPIDPSDPAQQKYALKVEKIVTQFEGEKDKMNFSSLSNIRTTEDAQMDTQSEIGYFLKSCRRRSTQEQSSQCLWRRVANYIDEEIDKGGEETVLLENVEKFELRYLGPGKENDEWIDAWHSGERGDAVTKGKFPFAVEVTLEVQDTKDKGKSLKMVIVAAVRNPNNVEDANAAAPDAK